MDQQGGGTIVERKVTFWLLEIGSEVMLTKLS